MGRRYPVRGADAPGGNRQGEWSRLGLGAAGAAASLGLDGLAMSAKGISIQNVDPRPEPAWGLLNATESLGAAAHIWTYGGLVHAMRDVGVEPIVGPDSTSAEIAGAVKLEQDLVAALDAMTICSFSSYAFSLDDYAAALGLVTHTAWDPDSFGIEPAESRVPGRSSCRHTTGPAPVAFGGRTSPSGSGRNSHSAFFERRTSVMTRAFGSPKIPRTAGSGRKPGKRYTSQSRRCRFEDV